MHDARSMRSAPQFYIKHRSIPVGLMPGLVGKSRN
jgi:hypothetical protein